MWERVQGDYPPPGLKDDGEQREKFTASAR